VVPPTVIKVGAQLTKHLPPPLQTPIYARVHLLPEEIVVVVAWISLGNVTGPDACIVGAGPTTGAAAGVRDVLAVPNRLAFLIASVTWVRAPATLDPQALRLPPHS
jgi:hypothetical protein